jgi:hypothetical protein
VIRAKFAKSKSASDFKVHVQGGVATIDGKTGSCSTRVRRPGWWPGGGGEQ